MCCGVHPAHVPALWLPAVDEHRSVWPPHPHQPWGCHLWPTAYRLTWLYSEKSIHEQGSTGAAESHRSSTGPYGLSSSSCRHRFQKPTVPVARACTQRLPDAQHSLCHALPGRPLASFGMCVENVSGACDADTGKQLKGLGGARIPHHLACNALHHGAPPEAPQHQRCRLELHPSHALQLQSAEGAALSSAHRRCRPRPRAPCAVQMPVSNAAFS